MKIRVAKTAGFCFGVKKAHDAALELSRSNDKVVMLGDIVHNEDVVNEIEAAGIKKISRLTKSKGKTLLVRAHGTGKKAIEKAHKLGYKVVDATCPMVTEIHKIAQDMEKKGYSIIVIGDKKHDEVQGIVGQLIAKPIVIDNVNNTPIKKLQKISKAAIVVQSTQNIDDILPIIKKVSRYVEDTQFFNTICRTTTVKQEEVKKMPLENDVMIIIGSKTSANTQRLYEISKTLNKKSHWVQSKKDIKSAWFRAEDNVGVTAGASTPDRTIKDVVKHIRSIVK